MCDLKLIAVGLYSVSFWACSGLKGGLLSYTERPERNSAKVSATASGIKLQSGMVSIRSYLMPSSLLEITILWISLVPS